MLFLHQILKLKNKIFLATNWGNPKMYTVRFLCTYRIAVVGAASTLFAHFKPNFFGAHLSNQQLQEQYRISIKIFNFSMLFHLTGIRWKRCKLRFYDGDGCIFSFHAHMQKYISLVLGWNPHAWSRIPAFGSFTVMFWRWFITLKRWLFSK